MKRLYCLILSKPTINRYLYGVLIGCVMAFTGNATTLRAISIKKTPTAVNKEIKTLIKEGWKTAPGWPSIESQVNLYHQMQAELDSVMSEVYLFSMIDYIEWNYNDAKMNAKELALQELAGMIQTQVIVKSETILKTITYNNEDIKTISIMKQVSKQIVMQRLQDVIPVMELFRKLHDGEFEVRVCWACKKNLADALVEEVTEKIKEYTKSKME